MHQNNWQARIIFKKHIVELCHRWTGPRLTPSTMNSLVALTRSLDTSSTATRDSDQTTFTISHFVKSNLREENYHTYVTCISFGFTKFFNLITEEQENKDFPSISFNSDAKFIFGQDVKILVQ